MNYIDPHIHMISRVTDDYQRMAYAGLRGGHEPAFWAGFDRGSADGFRDYFRHLTEVEPKRAALFNIRHYSWLCIQRQGSENVALSRDVIALIPEFLQKPNVLGIGEIGSTKTRAMRRTVFQGARRPGDADQRADPDSHSAPRGQAQGTRMIIDMAQGRQTRRAERVLIDHVEEHTVRFALEGGFWCGMTLYPTTKCTPARSGGHPRALWHRPASWRTPRATGASPTLSPCPS